MGVGVETDGGILHQRPSRPPPLIPLGVASSIPLVDVGKTSLSKACWRLGGMSAEALAEGMNTHLASSSSRGGEAAAPPLSSHPSSGQEVKSNPR